MRALGRTAALAALALAGCDAPVRGPIGAPSDAHAGPPERGGWLRMASYTNVRTLDPAVAFDEVAGAIEHFLFAKLIEFSPTGQGFVPDLAERWQASDDGLRVVFHLRRGALFHDGTEVRARDIKRSIERALHPDTPCPVSSFYERIAGYREYTGRKAAELSGVKVEGDYTLAIELSEPDATLLSVLALPTMAAVCPSAGATYDPDFARQACGAGPYKLASWEPGRSVRVARFEGYYERDKPYLDGIEYALSVPTFTQRFKFEGGQLDYLREFSEADLTRYLASPLWRGRGAWEPSRAVHSLFMNTEMPPFDNVDFRRAISAAIDRDQVAAVRPGSVRPATRIVPPAVPGHDPSPGQRFDLGRALDLMRRAGYPYDPATGKGGYPHELPYSAISDSFDVEAAQVLQQHLARIGVRIRIRPLGWPAYLAETSRRRTTAFGSDGWAADFPDPSDFFEPLFATKAINDEDSQNRAFYSNPALDALLDEARREPSAERRFALYRKAEDMVLDDAPWAVLYVKRWFELWHPYVHGYSIHPAHSEATGFAWIDQRARREALASASAPPLSRPLRGFLAAPGPRLRAAHAPPRDTAAAPGWLALGGSRLAMAGRALRRLGWSLLVLWGVVTLSFVINFALPGDPARIIAGPQARPADVARIRQKLGLDRPLAEQYTRFLRRLVHPGPAPVDPRDEAHGSCSSLGPLHLDLGVSYQHRRPVLGLLSDRLPASLLLALAAMAVQVGIGVATGTLAAVRKNTLLDHGVVALTLLGVSAPTFLIGLGLQYLFAFRLRLLPFDGYGQTFAERAAAVVLPALTLGLFGAAYYTRLVRDEVLGQLGQDYARTARAKGAGRARVLLMHVLRNTLLPLITVIGLDFGALVGGAIVTEKLFRWPGIGQLSVDAVVERDGPVILGTVLLASSAIVVANLLVDLSYALLDPRSRS